MALIGTSHPESELEQIKPPEIKADELSDLITRLSAHERIKYVLEIGSGAGEGSTAAVVKGLSQNPLSPILFCIEVSCPRFASLRAKYQHLGFVKCYNMSTVDAGRFPSESGVETGAIERIKREHNVTDFDLVLIDGSEFTGDVEFDKIYGAKIILLDDITTFKNFSVHKRLLQDPHYELIAENQTLRNGYSAFRLRASASRLQSGLPIHFFTIVLNGEPFIRYHERMLCSLPMSWHWHIVEGVAALRHDTAWSVASGGHVSDTVHRQGRSNDGTSEYLDDLAGRFPEHVTIYRKPLGKFWNGKLEMVNAPLGNIKEHCLLWQVDCDELWTARQVVAVHEAFKNDPKRSSAYYWCWYFVSPDKVISTRYNYAQNPREEWLRTWRFAPGDRWAAHEPPMLMRRRKNVGQLHPFWHEEMEAIGAVFQHFAYVIEAQLRFKETYYGYKNALAQWQKIQAHRGAGFLRDYLSWVADYSVFDDARALNIVPIAKRNSITGTWSFCTPEEIAHSKAPLVRPRIVIDGIFYQYFRTGIARVWSCLLEEWSRAEFADHIVVLDRAGTAPRVSGIHYRTINAHDYRTAGSDSLYLEAVCRELGADLFVSTYYSTPIETPSAFMGYDMIPELIGLDLNEEAWKEKRRAIEHACAHIMVSQNSANDLERIVPSVPKNTTLVAQCGVAAAFRPAEPREVEAFKARYNLTKAYVLHVGNRQSYKNGILLFRAISLLPDAGRFGVVCVGGHVEIEPAYRALVPDTELHRLELNDDELRAAYSGAHAYVCTSRYEGFGMPIIEAMACGCPVATCRNSSIPEIAGEAAIFVDEDDPTALAEALLRLDAPDLRAEYVRRGFAQAAKFSFRRMSEQIAAKLIETCNTDGAQKSGRYAWRELRTFQRKTEELSGALRSAPAMAITSRLLEPNPSSHNVSRLALVRKARKLVTGIKALSDLPGHYERVQQLAVEIRQLAASVEDIKRALQELPKRADLEGFSKNFTPESRQERRSGQPNS